MKFYICIKMVPDVYAPLQIKEGELIMDADRMVSLIREYGSDRILVNSSADWGISNPLAVPVTAELMRQDGMTEEIISKVMWENPIALFSKSGVFTKDELETELEFDQSLLYQGNSVLRGQRPEKRTND